MVLEFYTKSLKPARQIKCNYRYLHLRDPAENQRNVLFCAISALRVSQRLPPPKKKKEVQIFPTFDEVDEDEAFLHYSHQNSQEGGFSLTAMIAVFVFHKCDGYLAAYAVTFARTNQRLKFFRTSYLFVD